MRLKKGVTSFKCIIFNEQEVQYYQKGGKFLQLTQMVYGRINFDARIMSRFYDFCICRFCCEYIRENLFGRKCSNNWSNTFSVFRIFYGFTHYYRNANEKGSSHWICHFAYHGIVYSGWKFIHASYLPYYCAQLSFRVTLWFLIFWIQKQDYLISRKVKLIRGEVINFCFGI